MITSLVFTVTVTLDFTTKYLQKHDISDTKRTGFHLVIFGENAILKVSKELVNCENTEREVWKYGG